MFAYWISLCLAQLNTFIYLYTLRDWKSNFIVGSIFSMLGYHRYCPGSEIERFRGRGLIVLVLALRSSSYSYSAGHLTFSLPSFGSWTKYCHNNINRTICLWKIFDTHVFHIIYKNRMKTIIWNNDRELMLMYCSIHSV